MSKEEIMTEEEFKKYENIKVSDELVEKIKENSKDSFYKKMFKESLNKFKDVLDKGEYIENYIVGFNYTDNATRSYTSLIVPWISNPMFFDWTEYSILVKTNKKIYIVNLDMFNKFIKKIEVINNFDRYTKNKKNIYVKLKCVEENEDSGYKVLTFYKENKDRVDEFFDDCNVNIINKRYIESVNVVAVIEMIIVIIVIIYLAKKWNFIQYF
ncbi:hypothetical protein [Clostridium sp. Ade.TY]|uniref:hypothetical protein n=1 Tax=Clostridium sp. Ade.TY TaxID=1391647 RepID=UPI00041D3E04|nr:hypothetical protein [Clostridium sp. Ade.TY]